ncbi:hypothetical protein DOY81_007080 [Sarcophaga bullata]|nr:hypothetical protein DOY81_007080 [Sarcophaga bullata]
MLDWNNKNVVYVGGFSGIGYQVCQMMMKKQMKHLIVCSRMENVEMLKKLQAINSSVKVMFVQMNIADYASIVKGVKQVISHVGHVDVLINGVGVLADKDVETTVAVNLTGLINTTLMFMPYMDKTQSGHGGMVVNISSVYGLEPGPAFSVYSAAKHGVIGFTRSMADEHLYHKTGVAFMCICPGMTSTELMMNKRDMNWMKWVPHTEEMWKMVMDAKMQTPEECAVNMMTVMDQAKNGGIYICSIAGMKEITPTAVCKQLLSLFQAMELENKNVIYLGGFGGIGQKCVVEFLKRNINSLIIFDLKENTDVLKNLQNTYKSSQISFIPVDVTKSESIENAYKQAKEKLDSIDVVVNGCGLMNDRHLDLTIDINLRGVIQSSLTALNYMDKSKGGRGGIIVNISSIAGIEKTGMFAIYSAAKHGVTAFSRSMANPLYYHHTQVNFITICPGLTDTALLDELQDKTTLKEYAGPMVQRFAHIKRQSAEACAKNLVKAVENNKLGSVWLLDLGELSEIDMPILWKPTLIEN